MESALLVRLRELGPHAQLREQHAGNIAALMTDIEQICRAISNSEALVAELEHLVISQKMTIERLEREAESMGVQIERLEKQKSNKWGVK